MACRLHAADRRRREPYANHLLRVTILSHYRVSDPDMACAPVLHDAVEDHAVGLGPGSTRQAARARKRTLRDDEQGAAKGGRTAATGSRSRNSWAELRRHQSAMPTTENHAVSVIRPPTGEENPARSADNAARVSQWIRSQPRPVGVSDVRTGAARALPMDCPPRR